MRVLAGGLVAVVVIDDDVVVAADATVGDDAPVDVDVAATAGDDAVDVPKDAVDAPVDEATLRNSRYARSAPRCALTYALTRCVRVARLSAALAFVNAPVPEPASAPAGQSVCCLRIARVTVCVTPFAFGVLAEVDAVQRAADKLGWLVSRQQLTAALVHPPQAAAGVDHDALRKELCKRLQQGKLVLPCMKRARYPGIGRKLMVAPRPLAGVDQQITNGTIPGRLSPRPDQLEEDLGDP